jgi:methyl-accepting chemotaxis protein
MNNINDWRLSKKMTVAFGVIAVMMAATGINGIVANSSLSGVATRHVERGVEGTAALGRIVSALREHRIIIYSLATAEGAAKIASFDERYASNGAAIEQAIADYEPLAGDFLPQVEALKRAVATLDDANSEVFTAKQQGGTEAALALVKGSTLGLSRTTIEEAEQLIEMHGERSVSADEAGRATAFHSLLITLALLLAGFGVLFAVWRTIARTVAKPMSELSHATKVLAEGGTAQVPHRNRKDELGEVAKAVEMFRQAAVARSEADARSAADQQIVTSALGSGLSA